MVLLTKTFYTGPIYQPVMSLFGAVKSELVTIYKHAGYSLTDWFHKQSTRKSACSPTAVIIGGYLYIPSGLKGLSLDLEEENIRSLLWEYCSWKAITTNAEEITEGIIDNYYNRGREIYLIGHSLGGLIQRDILSRLPEPENFVKSVVFLGVPHQGTYIACLNYFVPACEDMIPGSEYLTELNQRRLPSNIPITNIVSSKDQCVFPRCNALLLEQDNIENIILDNVGHIGMTERTDLIINGLKRQMPAY